MKKKNKRQKPSKKPSKALQQKGGATEVVGYRPFAPMAKQLLENVISRLSTPVFSANHKENAKTFRRKLDVSNGRGADADLLPADMYLFWEEVKGITPINEQVLDVPEQIGLRQIGLGQACHEKKQAAGIRHEKEETEVIGQLDALCKGKTLLNVAQTPEFVEGGGWSPNPDLAKKLHKGRFSVQAYCDLHGLDVQTSIEVCEDFLKDALLNSKKCVAFIHGRGLSSKKEPVIKNMFLKWITTGPYRRFVLAYASAPARDGGAGVTYVLLRQHPAKRQRHKGGFKN